MEKILLLAIFTLLFTSCESMQNKHFVSSKMELRQLVNKEITSTNSSGYYFLIVGEYEQSTSTENYVKMLVKVGGLYRFIKVDLEDIRINIDNSIKKPSIQIKYISNIKESNTYLIDNLDWVQKTIIIHCPEQYLPEKLLNIEL